MLIATIVLFSIVLFSMAYFNAPVSSSDGQRSFSIRKGESASQISLKLKEQHFIRSSSYFLAVASFSGRVRFLKEGLFKISGSMSTKSIVDSLSNGRALPVIFRITIPEGFTAVEIAARFQENGLCDAPDFIRIVKDPSGNNIDTHGYDISNLEGFLFPETYFFDRTTSCTQMVQRMVDQFFKEFRGEYLERGKQLGLSINGIVTLASLIEEEAKVPSERPVISSVLHNRIRNDMLLQCDATVQYALPMRKERLLYKDLEIDSPYNTYRHRGLPPGPICNPGISSISAAVNPVRSGFFYYVAKGDGSHIFSRTDEEHIRAKLSVKRRANM